MRRTTWEPLSLSLSPNRPLHFSSGPRYTCALLARFRIGTYSLNYSLFKRGLVSSPSCVCGCQSETIFHFMFECPLFTQHRTNYLDNLANEIGHLFDFNSLSDTVKLHLVLRGSPSLSADYNTKIMLHTQTYIYDTQRF